jgi:predicted phosphodiesterase
LIARTIPTIRGNHDRWAIDRDDGDRDASGWTLAPTSVRFLSDLPLSWSAQIEGVRVAVHHARVGNDMNGIYAANLDDDRAHALLEAARADVLVVGHTHLPMAYRTADGRVIANPGTLCREGAEAVLLFDRETGEMTQMPTIRGTFGVLHLPERRFTVHYAHDGAEVDV